MLKLLFMVIEGFVVAMRKAFPVLRTTLFLFVF